MIPELLKRIRVWIWGALVASIAVFMFMSATAGDNPSDPDQVHRYPRQFKQYGVRYFSAQKNAALNLATDIFVLSLGLVIIDQIYLRREQKNKRERLQSQKRNSTK